jgi:hypothetical protein
METTKKADADRDHSDIEHRGFAPFKSKPRQNCRAKPDRYIVDCLATRQGRHHSAQKIRAMEGQKFRSAANSAYRPSRAFS